MKKKALRTIIAAVIFIGIGVVAAGESGAAPQSPEPIESSRLDLQTQRLLALDPIEQKAEIERMSATDARALRDYLRGRAMRTDNSAGAVFYLHEHLADIAAIDLAEKRMNKLLTVFAVSLLLFSGFLVYLLITQNRLIRRLQDHKGSDQPTSSSIYRGE